MRQRVLEQCAACAAAPLDVALLGPQGPAERVRQERIFGRIWYHNLSFKMRKQTGEGRSELSLSVTVPPAAS